MEYWLNWFANLIAEKAREREAGQGRRGVHDARYTFSAFKKTIASMMLPGMDREGTDWEDQAWFAKAIAPFAGFSPEKLPLAATLEPDAVFDFRQVEVDDGIRDYAQQAVARHGIVYLDIPERTYMLRGGVFQVRALFIWQGPKGYHFCAILTRPGSNRGWRMAWSEGLHARNARDSAFDDVWAMSSLDICDRCRPINFNRIDYSQFAEVEKIAWASIACWQDSIDANGVAAEDVLRMPLDIREQSLGIDVDPPVAEEPFSLFRLVRIRDVNPARIRAIREGTSAPGSAKCRHEVREFWRWQPCGKGRKELRRTKVIAHMRGRGAPKTPMHQVRSPGDF
jgi:hypothetical protein